MFETNNKQTTFVSLNHIKIVSTTRATEAYKIYFISIDNI